MKKYLMTGAAKIDVTPSVPLPYLAFYPRHQLFTGTASRMYLRALVLKNENCIFGIISFDGIGVDGKVLGEGDFYETLRRAIFERTGVNNIMFASSHIHSTPETLNCRPFVAARGAKEWLRSIIDTACEAVDKAKTEMAAARLYFSAQTVPGLIINRRGSHYMDETLSVICLKSLDGVNLATAVHFACHPVVMQVTENICTDYVGVVCESLERETGGVSLFLQGACGDIDPARFTAGAEEDYIYMGNTLSDAVLGMLNNLPEPMEDNSLSVTEEVLALPSRDLPSGSERDEIVRFYEQHRGKTLEKEDITLYRSAEEKYYRISEGDLPYKARLQLIKIGDMTLAGIPGEPFCQMGLELKKLAKNILIVGYANGYVGYIAPEAEWAKGGYETGLGMWSKVSAKAYDMIMDALYDYCKRGSQ